MLGTHPEGKKLGIRLEVGMHGLRMREIRKNEAWVEIETGKEDERISLMVWFSYGIRKLGRWLEHGTLTEE